jgi:hypothetical protein
MVDRRSALGLRRDDSTIINCASDHKHESDALIYAVALSQIWSS